MLWNSCKVIQSLFEKKKNPKSEKDTYINVHFQFLFFFIFTTIFDPQISLWNSLKVTVVRDDTEIDSDSRAMVLRLSIALQAQNKKEFLVRVSTKTWKRGTTQPIRSNSRLSTTKVTTVNGEMVGNGEERQAKPRLI